MLIAVGVIFKIAFINKIFQGDIYQLFMRAFTHHNQCTRLLQCKDWKDRSLPLHPLLWVWGETGKASQKQKLLAEWETVHLLGPGNKARDQREPGQDAPFKDVPQWASPSMSSASQQHRSEIIRTPINSPPVGWQAAEAWDGLQNTLYPNAMGQWQSWTCFLIQKILLSWKWSLFPVLFFLLLLCVLVHEVRWGVSAWVWKWRTIL